MIYGEGLVVYKIEMEIIWKWKLYFTQFVSQSHLANGEVKP